MIFLQSENRIIELQGQMEKQQEEHAQEVKALNDKVEATKGERDSAVREAKNSSMMDLEIADYERSVQTMNAQIDEREEKIKELEGEISRLEEKNTATQKLLGMLALRVAWNSFAYTQAWWLHDMLSTSLALWERNPPVTSGFPSQRDSGA